MKKNKRIASSIVIIVAIAVLAFIGLKFLQSHNKDKGNSSVPKNLIVPTQAYDDGSITLAWNKPDTYNNVVNYNIYINEKLIGNANKNAASKAKTFIDSFYNDTSNSSAVKVSMHTYIVTNLKPDTSYKFYVTAVDNKGHESKPSNTINQRTAKTPEVFDVTKYGAAGDTKTIDTKAIQAAITACSLNGEVLIPKGKTFKSGALWLKSGMTFKVDGKLLGSDNPQDYINSDHATAKEAKSSSLINAIGSSNSKNLKIIGSGIIDGNGWKQGTPETKSGFPNSLKSSIKTVEENGILAANQFKLGKNNGLSEVKAYATRSNLVSISHIDNVYFGDGISLENPAQQTIGISSCNNVVLNNVQIETFDCNNGDGIDFDSKGLTVLNSVFDTGDDDINFTAGKGADAEKTRKPVSAVWIFDNYFGRGHGAVVAGSNTAAWIENILAEDNVLNGTGSGLRCKTAPGTGGGAKNITFRDSALKNITDGEGEPFIFTSEYNNATAVGTFNPAPDLPQFKHIFVTNCSVNDSKNSSIFVAGLKDAYHEDIHFENVSFKNTQSAKISYMADSTFKNVKFDSSTKNPWNMTNTRNVAIK